ncbi:MAG: sulfatase [Chloroflexi bacterium]|nr:sulfatase [Chloroflexota bacterium]
MRPNILYIHSHDTGRFIQPYGHAVATPCLQRLAEEGVLFRRAFSAAPTCSPSRACLLTGQCAHSSGMLGLAHRGFALNDYSQHIVHWLRSAGYVSALAGVQHVAHDASMIGYDQVLAPASTMDLGSSNRGAWDSATVAATAAGYLRRPPDQPFFLSIGFTDTHREFGDPDPRDDPRYCIPPGRLPDTPAIRRDMSAFQSSARRLDTGIGIVLDQLQASGLADETLVICTTDHGIAFPGMKCTLTDYGIGVMLIMRGPGGFGGGKVCDAMVSQIDIFPTLCDLLDVDPASWLQGRSMMPLIRGESEEINEQIFAEVTYHAAYEPQRAVRTQRWKYIRRFGKRGTPVLPNTDDSPGKEVWVEHGWRERPVASEQLYDLVFDPTESDNLTGVEECNGILHDMRARLDQWMVATNDPLLQGDVPAPPGTRVNDAAGVSPEEPTMPACSGPGAYPE